MTITSVSRSIWQTPAVPAEGRDARLSARGLALWRLTRAIGRRPLAVSLCAMALTGAGLLAAVTAATLLAALPLGLLLGWL